jgi:hydroxyacylglutathione hydrolase
MRVVTTTGGIASTNCFLVADEKTKQAVLFDAPDHTVGPLLDEAAKQGWDLVGLWLTHGHFDHVADHAVVTARFPNARVLIHALDEPKLIAPHRQLFPLPFVIPPRRADAYVEDGQTLSLGGMTVQVMHTPGHAPGHVCYHFAHEQVLIGGDLIIMGAVGRTDLPDSDPAQLDESIRKVMKLPPATRLLSGHGQQSTLADEAEDNPFVRAALGL